MYSRQSKTVILALVMLLGAFWGASPAAAQIRCLPSCDPTDGRFLAIAGSNLITLSDTALDLTISVPADATSFQLGIFDGDARGVDGLLVPHWDTGVLPATYEYTLYTDPAANGTGSSVVEMLPGFPSLLSLTMPDNDWIDFTIPTSPDAQTPSGNYFYRLNIKLLTPASTIVNAFKVRTSAVVSGVTLDPTEQPFSYIANATSLADIGIIYPSYPSLTPTRYDGTFTFFFDVPVSQQSLAVWDGDYDRGKFDGTELDTDDPDTPGAPFLPAWATEDAASEGATGAPGNPADDRNPAATGIYLLKTPSVQYSLIFPDGQTFFNPNPSGNQEWEQFRISTDSFDPSLMDYSTSSIPPGIYELEAEGVDMQNLNALLLPFRFLCVDAENVPCEPLRPYRVGDTVFLDLDGDGNQGPGEPGRPGVAVNLLDDHGALLDTATTDADGYYSFEVEAYSYTVEVAAENFEPGGALEGYTSTTGDDRTDTVIDDNILTYDFGYRGTGSIGDRVWNDADGSGSQDAGEAGYNGVTVELLDANGTVVATTTTSGDGGYTFSALGPGDYSVRVLAATLPAGLEATYDLDGTDTADTAAVPLTAGENRTDVDFGYQAVPPSNPGTGTIGYWKNHAEAWPVEQITVGGVIYTKAQAIALMGKPGKGDKTYDLFKQLVAAKLNVIMGNDASCISATITSADNWLMANPVGSSVKSSSAAWSTGGPLHQALDDYNNGRLCAPHRG
jgi:hypothetical protein